MGSGLYQIFLYSLIYSVISANCCTRKPAPGPELKFPRATELAIQSSKDTEDIISNWRLNISKLTNFIPITGGIVSDILRATSVMKDLIPSAESEVGKLTGSNRAGTALWDIEDRLGTLKNHLEDVKRCIEEGRSFDVSTRLAAQECEEILQIFSNRENYLLNDDNSLYSAPSLMAFVGIYVGVAGIEFQIFKHSRDQVVGEMKSLERCLKHYEGATVAQRLSYVQVKAWESGLNKIEVCQDYFCKIGFCKYSHKFYCAGSEGRHSFSTYKTSVGKIYRAYFNGPLIQLEKLIQQFEENNNTRDVFKIL